MLRHAPSIERVGKIGKSIYSAAEIDRSLVPIAFFEIGVRRLRYGSGITVVNAQLRADETRLRAKVQGDVLEIDTRHDSTRRLNQSSTTAR
jgi:hypothetical protein